MKRAQVEALCQTEELFQFAEQTQAAASLTYSPLPTGQAAHSSVQRADQWSMSASVCSGEGVKRRRSVPRGTVG